MAFVALAGAGTAAASTLQSSAYPMNVFGTGTAAQQFYIPGAGPIECTAPALSGSISGPASSLSTTAGSSTCKYWGESPVKWNGCTLSFNFGSETPGHFGRFGGTLDIGPAGCGPIKLTENFLCTVSIPAQSGLAVSYENVPGAVGKVSATVNATGLKYTRSGSCGSGTFTNGTYQASWTLGTNSPYSLYLEGEAHTPSFEAESYPASATGSQIGTSQFTGAGGETHCEKATLAASASTATTTVTATPSFANCVSAGIVTEAVNVNGCTYVLHAGAKIAAGKYGGTADVNCPAGKAIEFKSVGCTVSIPAQSGLSGVEFVNDSSSGYKLRVNAAVSGIQLTVVKHNFLCPLTAGNYTNGKLTGSVMMEGTGGNGIRVGG
jgi:hypothetical protein